MNRNNFLPHIALALVLILVAAFAGQLRRWQIQMKNRARIFPAADKRREPINNIDAAPYETHDPSAPEVLVKFKPGVTEDTIEKITLGLHDRVEDEIESVPGLAAIDDLDYASAESVAAQYRAFADVSMRKRFSKSARMRFHRQLRLAIPGSRNSGLFLTTVQRWNKGCRHQCDHCMDCDYRQRQSRVAVLDSGVDYTHSDLATAFGCGPTV